MKALVLGGNGYLGSKVVLRLLKEGHVVVCTKRENSDLSRLQNISEQDIKWIAATNDDIDEECRKEKFDIVLNMACNYGRGNSTEKDIIEANLIFPLMVLDRAVTNGTKKYLTIGTGLPNEFNMYSFSKKVFGDYGKFYANQHNISFYNLKLEMFYGSDEPQNRFLPYVINGMMHGEEINTTLGTQHRDIISIDDIVKAIMMVLGSQITGYHDIPVGTGEAPSIGDVIDFIWEETGKKSKLNKGAIPMRQDEPDCVADISFLDKLGEWKPVHWKDGIREMIAQYEI